MRHEIWLFPIYIASIMFLSIATVRPQPVLTPLSLCPFALRRLPGAASLFSARWPSMQCVQSPGVLSRPCGEYTVPSDCQRAVRVDAQGRVWRGVCAYDPHEGCCPTPLDFGQASV
uniref:Uncharacterized protein n=1 Tax=viral metagenome TaxID=1070528 RepID=A0A6C0KF33_9ZZZZ